MNEAAEIIYDLVDPNALIIFGAVIDDQSEWLAPGEVAITIIATGAGGRGIADFHFEEPCCFSLVRDRTLRLRRRCAPLAGFSGQEVAFGGAAVKAAPPQGAAAQPPPPPQPAAAAPPQPQKSGGGFGVSIPDFLKKRSKF